MYTNINTLTNINLLTNMNVLTNIYALSNITDTLLTNNNALISF